MALLFDILQLTTLNWSIANNEEAAIFPRTYISQWKKFPQKK